MWAAPDPDKIQLLLDAGADVNARSDDRRTALVVASGIVGAAPALRLLSDTARTRRSGSRQTRRRCAKPCGWTRREMFRVLVEYGASPNGAGGMSATFLRTNCFKCAELAGARWTLAPTSS